MARTENINLDGIIAARLHAPRIDKVPIYARVDGEMEKDGSSLETSGSKSEKWVNAVKRTYNSPDNVRRVFITHKGVYVHMFKPIYGLKSSSLKMGAEFKVDILTVAGTMQQKQLGQATPYRVTGTGLGPLVRPWVCSNIEEVYFDWSILLSQDVNNFGFGDLLSLYGPMGGQKMPTEIIKGIFERICLDRVKDLRTRFPRLKAVGYIPDLEQIYNGEPDKPGTDSIEELKTVWVLRNTLAKAAMASSRATVWRVPGSPELNYNRSIKPSTYMFDRDVLDPYFNAMEARIKSHQRTERSQQNDIKKEALLSKANTIKGSFEEMLDSISGADGVAGVRTALVITFKGRSKREREAAYESLTDSGKVKYGSIFEEAISPKKKEGES